MIYDAYAELLLFNYPMQRNIYYVLEKPEDLVSISSDTSQLSSKLDCYTNMLENHAVSEQIQGVREGNVINMNDCHIEKCKVDQTLLWWVQIIDKILIMLTKVVTVL